MKKSWNIIGYYLLIIVAVVILLLLSSCKTQYVPVETVRTEYVTKTDSFIQKDSIFCHDSVFIHAKNDTIFYERWHTKYVEKYIDNSRIDSFIKVDSVQVPYPVERKLSKWEQVKMDFGSAAIGISIVAVIAFIIWIILWLRRKSLL